jgi:hypothetical protein
MNLASKNLKVTTSFVGVIVARKAGFVDEVGTSKAASPVLMSPARRH